MFSFMDHRVNECVNSEGQMLNKWNSPLVLRVILWLSRHLYANKIMG